MQSIAPATTTTTAILGVTSDGPFCEAQRIATPPVGRSALEQAAAQFFAGGGSSLWVVRMQAGEDLPHALSALDAVASLNLVAMPDVAALQGDAYQEAIGAIAEYCAKRGAFFIVDPPADWTDVDAVERGVGSIASIVQENGAVYWPPSTTGALSGAIAAVYVTTDQTRGVWKAPAGLTAVLPDTTLSIKLTDAENGVLNPLGVNCIRVYPSAGTVVWGARTLAGADVLASDFKYVNVRRLALFVEASIREGLQWTALSANDPTLWSAIRQVVTQFLSELYNAGAFAGTSAAQAFFVRCDATTTTQQDIDEGIVNVAVGFAPIAPAEFLLLQISAAALPPVTEATTRTTPPPPSR